AAVWRGLARLSVWWDVSSIDGIVRRTRPVFPNPAGRSAGGLGMDATAFDAPPTTILVVEDDPAIGRLLHETLEAEGYAAVVAPSGEQGIAYALREVPQLLVLDLMLPGMDGFAVVECLRGNVKTAHIPVMILSARHDTADKIRAFDIEVDDYLTKPFHIGELIARIRTQLRRVRDN